MATFTISATRQELMRLRRKKKTAERGRKLLKDKRDSLMQTFLGIIRETIALRKTLDQHYLDILEEFRLAKLQMDEKYVDLLAKTPSTTIELFKEIRNVMSVRIPMLEIAVEGNFLNYGLLETNPHLDNALKSLRELLPQILKLVEKEYAAYKLAEEIEKTRRRVNALDYVIIPQVEGQIIYIRGKLEEQARQATVSLIKMKQRMAS